MNKQGLKKTLIVGAILVVGTLGGKLMFLGADSLQTNYSMEEVGEITEVIYEDNSLIKNSPVREEKENLEKQQESKLPQKIYPINKVGNTLGDDKTSGTNDQNFSNEEVDGALEACADTDWLQKNYSYEEINATLEEHKEDILATQELFEQEDIGIRDSLRVENYFYYVCIGGREGLYKCNIDGTDNVLIAPLSSIPEYAISSADIVSYDQGETILYVIKRLREAVPEGDEQDPIPRSVQYVLDKETLELTKEEDITVEEFLTEIAYNLECLNECLIEKFTVDVDYSNCFEAAYKDEESYNDGRDEPEFLYREADVGKYDDYFLDPTGSGYYPVENYKDISKVKSHLENYLLKDIIEMYPVEENFYEYEGTLYLVRGSRGYGAQTINLDSAEYLGQENGVYNVGIDIMFFGELDRSGVVGFENINGDWVLTEMEID